MVVIGALALDLLLGFGQQYHGLLAALAALLPTRHQGGRLRVTRAYKTELDLNHTQVTACKRHASAARYAYNWGLVRKQEAYKATGRSPSAIALHRELNVRKQTDLPWLYQVSTCAPQEALRNLDAAFAHFFRRCALKRAGTLNGTLGYPQRTTKKKGLGSFRLTGAIVVFPAAIQLPRLGRLRVKERGYLPTAGVRVLSATISEQAGHWYVSVQVVQEQAVAVNTGPVVGVDLGVKTLATCSDGTVFPNPTPLTRRLKKIKPLHRAVTRKPKGSKNRKKAARQLGTAYRRVSNQRANTLHQVTTWLATTKAVIVLEDLHVVGMLRNHHLAQAISDVGFGEFGRQLTYKAKWYGSRIVLASRWEPSSKTCSACGWVDADLTLADRTFRCEQCGLVLDRDLNAAINLATLAGSSSERQNACGVGSAGRGGEAAVKLPTQAGARLRKKQEPNTVCAEAEIGRFWRTAFACLPPSGAMRYAWSDAPHVLSTWRAEEERMATLAAVPLDEIRAARERIAGAIVRTPLLRLAVEDAPCEIYLKLESLQPIGSFKLRGASNVLLSQPAETLTAGVWTASAGNMAQGVAWQARRMGVPCAIVVPDHAPETKLAAIRRLGGRIVKVPFAEWFAILSTRSHPGMEGTFVHPFGDPLVQAGNGTIGLEIVEDLPDVDAVVIPYGGGGLSCGIASALRALKPDTHVYACEVETAAPLAAAFIEGAPTPVEYTPSFVDGMGSPQVLPEMWPLASALLDGSLVSTLAEVAAAVRLLVERARVVAEGAGAAPVAAALAGMAGAGKVVCVLSGGNIDTAKLVDILQGDVP
jgi:IS605 OrfB family transposase